MSFPAAQAFNATTADWGQINTGNDDGLTHATVAPSDKTIPGDTINQIIANVMALYAAENNRRSVVAVTAATTLTDAQIGTTVTNTGASGAPSGRAVTLPTAAAGKHFRFVDSEGVGLKIVAGSGDTIVHGAASDGDITTTGNGENWLLVAVDNTQWVLASGSSTGGGSLPTTDADTLYSSDGSGGAAQSSIIDSSAPGSDQIGVNHDGTDGWVVAGDGDLNVNPSSAGKLKTTGASGTGSLHNYYWQAAPTNPVASVEVTGAGCGEFACSPYGTPGKKVRLIGDGGGYLSLTSTGIVAFTNDANAAGTQDAAIERAEASVLKITDANGGGCALEFPQVSSGGTPSANSTRDYSKDVAGTAEKFVQDEAGHETQISMHNHAGPDWLYDHDDPMPRVLYERNPYLRVERWTNDSRKARLLERMFGGEDISKLPEQQRTCVFEQKLPDEECRNWADDQDAKLRSYQAQRNLALDQKTQIQARADALSEQANLLVLGKSSPAALAAAELFQEAAGLFAAQADAVPVLPDVDIRKSQPTWMESRVKMQKPTPKSSGK